MNFASIKALGQSLGASLSDLEASLAQVIPDSVAGGLSSSSSSNPGQSQSQSRSESNNTPRRQALSSSQRRNTGESSVASTPSPSQSQQRNYGDALARATSSPTGSLTSPLAPGSFPSASAVADSFRERLRKGRQSLESASKSSLDLVRSQAQAVARATSPPTVPEVVDPRTRYRDDDTDTNTNTSNGSDSLVEFGTSPASNQQAAATMRPRSQSQLSSSSIQSRPRLDTSSPRPASPAPRNIPSAKKDSLLIDVEEDTVSTPKSLLDDDDDDELNPFSASRTGLVLSPTLLRKTLPSITSPIKTTSEPLVPSTAAPLPRVIPLSPPKPTLPAKTTPAPAPAPVIRAPVPTPAAIPAPAPAPAPTPKAPIVIPLISRPSLPATTSSSLLVPTSQAAGEEEDDDEGSGWGDLTLDEPAADDEEEEPEVEIVASTPILESAKPVNGGAAKVEELKSTQVVEQVKEPEIEAIVSEKEEKVQVEEAVKEIGDEKMGETEPEVVTELITETPSQPESIEAEEATKASEAPVVDIEEVTEKAIESKPIISSTVPIQEAIPVVATKVEQASAPEVEDDTTEEDAAWDLNDPEEDLEIEVDEETTTKDEGVDEQKEESVESIEVAKEVKSEPEVEIEVEAEEESQSKPELERTDAATTIPVATITTDDVLIKAIDDTQTSHVADAETESIAESEVIIKSEPTIEPESLIQPEPTVEKESVVEDSSAVKSETLVDSEPVIEDEPVAEPEPEPVIEDEPAVDSESILDPEPKPSSIPEAPIAVEVAESDVKLDEATQETVVESLEPPLIHPTTILEEDEEKSAAPVDLAQIEDVAQPVSTLLAEPDFIQAEKESLEEEDKLTERETPLVSTKDLSEPSLESIAQPNSILLAEPDLVEAEKESFEVEEAEPVLEVVKEATVVSAIDSKPEVSVVDAEAEAEKEDLEEVETKAETTVVPEVESVVEPEADAPFGDTVKTEVRADVEPAVIPDVEPAEELLVVPAVESEVEAKVADEAQVEAEPLVVPEAVAEVEIEPEAEVEPEPEVDSVRPAESVIKPKVELEAEPAVAKEVDSTPQVDAEPTPEAQPQAPIHSISTPPIETVLLNSPEITTESLLEAAVPVVIAASNVPIIHEAVVNKSTKDLPARPNGDSHNENATMVPSIETKEAAKGASTVDDARYNELSAAHDRLSTFKTSLDKVVTALFPTLANGTTDVDAFEGHIKGLQGQADESSAEISKLTGQLKQQTERIEELRDAHRLEHQSSVADIDELRASLETKVNMIATLESRLSAATSSSQDAHSAEFDKLKLIAKEEEEKRVKALSLLRALRHKLVKAEKDKEFAEGERDTARGESERATETLKSDRSRFDQEVISLRAAQELQLNKMRGSFDRELASLRQQHDRDTASKKAQADLDIVTLKAAHSKEIKMRDARIKELEDTVKNVTLSRDEAFAQAQTRAAELEARDASQMSAEGQMKELGFEVNELRDRNGALLDEVEGLRKQQRDVSRDESAQRRALNDAETRHEQKVKDLETRIRELETDRIETDEEWGRNLQERLREVERMRSAMAQKDVDYAESVHRMRERETKIEEGEKQRKDLAAQLFEIEGLLKTLKEENDKLIQAEAAAREELNDKVDRTTALENRVEELQNKESTLRSSHKALREELRKLQSGVLLSEKQRNPGVGFFSSFSNSSNASVAVDGLLQSPTIGSPKQTTPSTPGATRAGPASIGGDEALNFEYIRNVILQFLERPEMRPHLVGVLGVILHFTPSESRRLAAKAGA